MFFIPTFLRRSFGGYALGQSSLTLFLLSSALGFLVSSYTIDDSCRNYKRLGNDISEDIERAIQEARLLASQAYTEGVVRAPNAYSLLVSLFGTDQRKHKVVVQYFAPLALQGFATDFVVICNDQQVQLEHDVYKNPPDPFGVWVDHRYSWAVPYDDFMPCDPARKPGAPSKYPYSYIINTRLIYLCPSILDNTGGRTLAPYKDQDHTGRFIDEFWLLPAVLLQCLIFCHYPNFVGDAHVQDFPPGPAYVDPNINVYDPQYLRSLPMVVAQGFSLCHKLGQDNPDVAMYNCNSLGIYALGVYLWKNDWGGHPVEGFGLPPLLY